MSDALTLKVESLDALRAEGVEDLVATQWEEVEDHHERCPLAIDWPAYYAMERAGIFKALALRRGSRLIGYSSWFIKPLLHHRLTTWAVCDILYVDPTSRGRAGVTLIRGAEPVLRDLGAQVILYTVKPSKGDLDDTRPRDRVGALLRRLGYSLAEESWARWL